MTRRVALLIATGLALAVAATAVAREAAQDELSIEMTRGCLDGTRVTVRIAPPTGEMLSPVHVRTSRGEAVHLAGVTQRASVIVRLPSSRGRVTVSGASSAGERFSFTRAYRACAPEPTPAPRARPRPAPPPRTISGGGEG